MNPVAWHLISLFLFEESIVNPESVVKVPLTKVRLNGHFFDDRFISLTMAKRLALVGS